MARHPKTSLPAAMVSEQRSMTMLDLSLQERCRWPARFASEYVAYAHSAVLFDSRSQDRMKHWALASIRRGFRNVAN